MMQLIFHQDFLGHETGRHPECKERLFPFRDLPDAPLPDGQPFLAYAHGEAYIERVRQSVASGEWMDAETPVSSGTYTAAVKAVGATMLAAQTGGFALVRPPGHHAYPNHSSGFCIFNNVAVASSYLASEGKRVLIFDFDGHLGDGTSRIFDGSNQVMYWSMHQYPAFPGHGFVDEIGVGAGMGYTINTPLPPGSGDDIFWQAFESYLPIALQFKPDVLAISAGFDGYQHDPLLDLRYSLDLFYKLGLRLADIFPNRFATLEGGYNLQALPKCIYNFLAGSNRMDCPYVEAPTQTGLRIWEEHEARLYAGLHHLKPYWTIN